MKIFFVKKLPSKEIGYFASYIFQKHNNSLTCIDLKLLIRANHRNWLDQIYSWHQEISNRATKEFKYWRLLPGSRFHTWYPPIFKPYFFSISLLEYCKKNNIGEVYLLDCPSEVLESLKELDPDLQIEIETEYFLLPLIFVSNRLKPFIKKLIQMIYLSFKNIFKTDVDLKNKKFIIYSHIVDGLIHPDRPDHFFGNMLDEFQKKFKDDLLWVYYSENTNSLIHEKFSKNLNQQKKKFTVLQFILKPWDVFKAMGICIQVYFFYKKVLPLFKEVKIGPYKSKQLSMKYFNYYFSNLYPLDSILVFLSMKKIFKNNSHIQTLLYPYEEKTLDYALLMATKENASQKIKTIGYAHSACHQLHYYFKQTNGVSRPMPNLIAVTGEYEKKWLKEKTNFDDGRFTVFGSSRYVANTSQNSFQKSKQMLQVLVLMGQDYEPSMLAHFLDEEPTLFDQCEVVIRLYPFGWIEEQKRGLESLKRRIQNLKCDNSTSMEHQIQAADVVLFTSTSGGIVSALSGKLSLFIDMNDGFYLDPYEGKDESNPYDRYYNGKELKAALSKIKNLNSIDYNSWVSRQQSVALKVYGKPDLSVIEKSIGT